MSRTDERDRRDEREDRSHVRPTAKRPVPFLASGLVAFLLLPLLYLISWLLKAWDDTTGVIIADWWLGAGCILALIAALIGLRHARRAVFVCNHVAITLFLIGVAGHLYTLLGWQHPFMNVSAFFITAITYLSWMLYRIDVFRAKATGESNDTWGEVIGLLRSRPQHIEITEGQVSFDVAHGQGESHADVVRGMAHVANAGHALTGRTTVTEGERGGVSHVAISTADNFANWLRYPGPSHPGASFANPIGTAYYENGQRQWYSLAPNPFASPMTPFRSHMRSHMGGAGITGAGKSGWFNNLAVDAGFTRIDVCVAWVDAEKLMQNAGWCMDFLTLAAGNPEQAKILTRGLRGDAEWRVGVLGQAALDAAVDPAAPFIGREWSAEVAQQLSMPAWLIIVDEADTIIRTKAWEWISARGASLGMFLAVGAPRVSTAEVSALLRGSVGTWKTFGMGDQISDMFTLPPDIKDTVDPSRWRDPGLHVLTGASGVPRTQWAWLAREYKNDVRELREIVVATREGRLLDRTGRPVCEPFEPMEPSAEEQRWLGEAWEKLRPEVLMKVRPAGPTRRPDDEDDEVAAVPETPDGKTPAEPDEQAAPVEDEDDAMDDAVHTEGGKRVVRTSAVGTVVDDDEAAAMDQTAVDPEVARDAADIDPEQPFDTTVPDGDPVDVPYTKPKVSTEKEEEALAEVVRVFWNRGKTRATNQEFIDAMPVYIGASTLSRRLHRWAQGERIVPPGLLLEEDPASTRGAFIIVERPPSPHRTPTEGH